MEENNKSNDSVCGTLVGESTTQEFRMSVTPGRVQVQDLVVVDATLQDQERNVKPIRVWAKVESIERINPLFPRESGQELADLQIDPFDTVISMSREMITAVCRILGYENTGDGDKEPLKKLRYPPQPASSVYHPVNEDLQRIVAGNLIEDKYNHRKLDLGQLSTRQDVDLYVDGHPIVSRHVAILAMTGAGKSWAAKRIIEELSKKQYPIIIFDPHGEYSSLSQIEELSQRVQNYYPDIQIFDEDANSIMRLISGLCGSSLSPKMETLFIDLFSFCSTILQNETSRTDFLNRLRNIRPNDSYLSSYGLRPDLFGVAAIGDGVRDLILEGDHFQLAELGELGYDGAPNFNRRDAETLRGIVWRTRKAAGIIARMAAINRRQISGGRPIPNDVKELVARGKICVVGLSGYTPDIRASMYNLITEKVFQERVQGAITLPFLLVLEEAHNFVPSSPSLDSEKQSLMITRQIAQEGRKFGVGLIMISQRPSRLDETSLAQCNSFVIMRLVNPADQQFVKRVIETIGEQETKLLPDLEIGEAIISGQCVQFPVLTKIKPPKSRSDKEEDDLIRDVLNYEEKSNPARRRS